MKEADCINKLQKKRAKINLTVEDANMQPDDGPSITTASATVTFVLSPVRLISNYITL